MGNDGSSFIRLTCLVAISKDVTPSNWKQSAATDVVAKKRSMMFTAKQQDSNDSLKCL